jgi:hypothetical protein
MRVAREKRHLGFRQVWACLSAVSIPVLLQFTAWTRATVRAARAWAWGRGCHPHWSKKYGGLSWSWIANTDWSNLKYAL